jgi:hypothetical protein
LWFPEKFDKSKKWDGSFRKMNEKQCLSVGTLADIHPGANVIKLFVSVNYEFL